MFGLPKRWLCKKNHEYCRDSGRISNCYLSIITASDYEMFLPLVNRGSQIMQRKSIFESACLGNFGFLALKVGLLVDFAVN